MQDIKKKKIREPKIAAYHTLVMNKHPSPTESIWHAEDIGMKAAGQSFGPSLLHYMGIAGTILAPAPTEHVHLEVKQMYEDFNYIMDDQTWCHFEFESDSIKPADLRRFRQYEAITGFSYNVDVITHVVCSANTKNLISELHTGINTYHVNLIRFKDRNADEVFQKLDIMQKSDYTPDDLLPVSFTPLMSGTTTLKDRILKAFTYLKEENNFVTKEELKKLQSILYLLATKFLTKKEMDEVKEGMNMTYLGQLIFDDGANQGIQQGLQQGIEKTTISNIRSIMGSLQLSPKQAMDALQIPLESQQKYMELLSQPH